MKIQKPISKIKCKNNTSKMILQNENGQFAFEGILLVVLFAALFLYVTKEMRERQMLASMISGPWKVISGMISTGNWEPTETAMSAGHHPHNQVISRKGDQ